MFVSPEQLTKCIMRWVEIISALLTELRSLRLLCWTKSSWKSEIQDVCSGLTKIKDILCSIRPLEEPTENIMTLSLSQDQSLTKLGLVQHNDFKFINEKYYFI